MAVKKIVGMSTPEEKLRSGKGDRGYKRGHLGPDYCGSVALAVALCELVCEIINSNNINFMKTPCTITHTLYIKKKCLCSTWTLFLLVRFLCDFKTYDLHADSDAGRCIHHSYRVAVSSHCVPAARASPSLFSELYLPLIPATNQKILTEGKAF